MTLNKLFGTSVRFIAPTADLSALDACIDIRIILLNLIIVPAWEDSSR